MISAMWRTQKDVQKSKIKNFRTKKMELKESKRKKMDFIGP